MMGPARLVASLLLVVPAAFVLSSCTPTSAPIVLYTDIVSGPTTGGEGGLGTYLSIFGTRLGTAAGLGGTTKVFIGGAEVASYRSLGPSKGRSDISALTVQVGALGSPTPGVAVPIKVVVNGVASNLDHTFKPNPGRMLFVDNVHGNDATAVVGDPTKPFRTVQGGASLATGAWGQVRPGDTIVMRAGTWTDVGSEGYFLRFRKADNTSGTAPTGAAGTGPITLMGYPGEDVFIDATAATHPNGAVSGLNGQNYPNAGKWAVVTGLRIEGGGHDGPISQEIYGDNWRVVNNELTATTGVATSKMGGITGNGLNAVWMGNHIHDIKGSSGEAHGIYIDGNGSYDIAYNSIHDIKSGNGFQTYSNGSNGSDNIDNVKFHHNIVHDVSKHLINIADGSRNGFAIWDNVAYNTPFAAVRFNTTDLVGMKLAFNTFANFDTSKSSNYGALTNDWGLGATAVDIRNNIFVATAGTAYAAGSVGIAGTEGTITGNLWFGGAGSTAFDSHPITANPLFVSATDHHLQTGSPGINAATGALPAYVTNDVELHPRPAGGTADVGAYER